MFSKLRIAAFAAPFLLVACGGANSESPKAENSTEGSSPKIEKDGDGNASETAAAGDMVLGDANAPVTVIEYASITCPGCAAFHANILPEIKEKYIDTGKVKLIFREFPTPPVEFSYIGSVLARCASEKSGPDTYFLLIDSLLKNQRTWIYGEDPKVELLKLVSQVGMDETAFDACLQRQELVDAMNERIEEGRDKYDISSTPSFVIGGEKRLFRSAEDFMEALDTELGVESDAASETE